MIWKHELEQHDSDNEDVEDDDNGDDEMFIPTGDETTPPVEDEDEIDIDVTSISKPWKKSIIEPEGIEMPIGKIIYIYIYMCVCVCVCRYDECMCNID